MKTLLIIIGIIVLVIVVAVITNYSIESNKEEIVEKIQEILENYGYYEER